jgi:hypothetical protein
MTTEQKLELIVDRLLVKTQDGHCKWKKDKENKFSLKTGVGIISLYGGNTIILAAIGNANLDVVIASKCKDKIETESNLVRLFDAVITYYNNYVNEEIGKILTELEKL